MTGGSTVISPVLFFLFLSRTRSESTVSRGLSRRVNPNGSLQSFRLNYRSTCSQNPSPPHSASPMQGRHFPDTFSHNTLTLVGTEIEVKQWAGGLLKECANIGHTTENEKKKAYILSPFLPLTQRETQCKQLRRL